MCFQKASCASVTSACSPTDSDTTTSPWPKACSLSSKLQKPNLRAKILSNRKHSGTVHVAAARCVLPADSQPWRSTLHDSATISSLRLACARLPRRVPALDLHSENGCQNRLLAPSLAFFCSLSTSTLVPPHNQRLSHRTQKTIQYP